MLGPNGRFLVLAPVGKMWPADQPTPMEYVGTWTGKSELE